jgi:hypothetical protein
MSWYNLMSVLSLDGAEVWLPSMGLGDNDAPSLRVIARTYLGRLPDPVEFFAGERTVEESKGLDQRLRRAELDAKETLARDLGVEAAARIEDLAAELSPVGGAGLEFRWQHLFWLLAYGRDEGHALVPIDLPGDRLDVIAHAIRREFPRDRDDLVETSKEEPSEWDAQLLTAWRASASGLDPYVSLDSGLKDIETRRSWRALKGILSAAELDELVRWANAQPSISGRIKPVDPPDW